MDDMGRDDAVNAMRAEVSAALVAADYDTDLGGYQWHPCPTCPSGGAPCACAGIPWLSDDVWEAMRPHLAAAVDAAAPHLTADLVRERDALAAEVERWKDRHPCEGCSYHGVPQEDCPRHGRPYAEWVERGEQMQRERDEALAEVERYIRKVDDEAYRKGVVHGRLRDMTDRAERAENTITEALSELDRLEADGDYNPYDALRSVLRDGATNCTCGYGGFHEPENPRCERNTHLIRGGS